MNTWSLDMPWSHLSPLPLLGPPPPPRQGLCTPPSVKGSLSPFYPVSLPAGTWRAPCPLLTEHQGTGDVSPLAFPRSPHSLGECHQAQTLREQVTCLHWLSPIPPPPWRVPPNPDPLLPSFTAAGPEAPQSSDTETQTTPEASWFR